ncbi:flavin-containing monooxygenase [Streptomyces sp. NPDC017988]|uniref:flavin-containing monooxygenase n=1 Tax=Streptomyces sp. NPDC017988 TaxID=3365025 RepID=UPI003794A2D1
MTAAAHHPHVHTAVIGSGYSGIGTAIRLKQSGTDDFVILEKAPRLGGAWRDNAYPGAACDVPGHLYAFSFAPNTAWRTTLPTQPEVLAYLEHCATRYALHPHLRLNCELTSARWRPDEGRWRPDTTRGAYTASVLVVATGLLSTPHIPGLPGLETFQGPAFHTARWDHEADLTGKRVAVIGTGASAVQCIPHLQRRAAHLDVYQRTPPWVLPRLRRRTTALERAALRHVPGLPRLLRHTAYWSRELWALAFVPGHPWARVLAATAAHLHRLLQLRATALRGPTRPSYRVGCKRILLASDYYPALRQPNVDVVAQGVEKIGPRTITTADGSRRPADVIVFATGFRVHDPPVSHRVTGTDGRTLAEHWGEGMAAHNNVTVPGFPNLFLLLGPNSGLGHSSLVLMLEAQLDHVLACLGHLERTGAQAIEATREAWPRHADVSATCRAQARARVRGRAPRAAAHACRNSRGGAGGRGRRAGGVRREGAVPTSWRARSAA